MNVAQGPDKSDMTEILKLLASENEISQVTEKRSDSDASSNKKDVSIAEKRLNGRLSIRSLHKHLLIERKSRSSEEKIEKRRSRREDREEKRREEKIEKRREEKGREEKRREEKIREEMR